MQFQYHISISYFPIHNSLHIQDYINTIVWVLIIAHKFLNQMKQLDVGISPSPNIKSFRLTLTDVTFVLGLQITGHSEFWSSENRRQMESGA